MRYLAFPDRSVWCFKNCLSNVPFICSGSTRESVPLAVVAQQNARDESILAAVIEVEPHVQYENEINSIPVIVPCDLLGETKYRHIYFYIRTAWSRQRFFGPMQSIGFTRETRWSR